MLADLKPQGANLVVPACSSRRHQAEFPRIVVGQSNKGPVRGNGIHRSLVELIQKLTHVVCLHSSAAHRVYNRHLIGHTRDCTQGSRHET